MVNIWTENDFTLSTDTASGKIGFLHDAGDVHLGFASFVYAGVYAPEVTGGVVRASRSASNVCFSIEDIQVSGTGAVSILPAGTIANPLLPPITTVVPISDSTADPTKQPVIVVSTGGAMTLRNAEPGVSYRGVVNYITPRGWWPHGDVPGTVVVETV